ncbi:MAG: GatB/YqeY domain-containing protein [Bacteroidales bacterium]|jgi:uncharacterized protein YqeY|nr:GatB/YqeY domain-containing protein [Bacteroidales bacterium]
MTIYEQINEDIKAAMKAREKDKLEALRNIKKVMIEAKAAKGANTELTDEESIKIISKLAKQGCDSADIYKQQGREDLYSQEMKQIAVYEIYLPNKLTDTELTAAIAEIIEKNGATSLKDLGKVMGIASKELAGKADGKNIMEKIKSILK